jgi:hypothetical protein
MKTVTVKQIHDELDAASDNLVNAANVFFVNFDNEVKVITDREDAELDRLRAREKELLSMPTESERTKRLRESGFTSSPEVVESTILLGQWQEDIRNVLNQIIKKRNERDAAIAEANKEKARSERVLYYRKTYPDFKFLTQEQLDSICKKYNLIYASVKNYTGDVPDKNLKEIASATIRREDIKQNVTHVRVSDASFDGGDAPFTFDIDEKPFEHYRINWDSPIWNAAYDEAKKRGYHWPASIKVKSFTTNYAGFYIAAPKSHFAGLGGFVRKGFGFLQSKTWKLVSEPKDPIVFRYVRGGVLIISKWGTEAEDELLKND